MPVSSEREIISGIVIAYSVLCFLVGSCGNVLILFVYFTKRAKTSTNILIIALGSGDLLLCIMRLVDTFTNHGLEYFSVVSRLNDMVLYASGFITAAVAFDRYDAICRPNRRFMSPARAKILSVVCQVLGILVGIPSLLDPTEISSTNLCYSINCIPAFLCSACLAIVVGLYMKIYHTVRKRVKVSPSWRGRQQQQQQCKNQPQSGTDCTPVAAQAGQAKKSTRQTFWGLEHFPSTIMLTLASSEEQATHPSIQNPNNLSTTHSQTAPPTRKATQSTHCHLGSIAQKTTKMLILSTAIFFVTWIPFIVHHTWVASNFCYTKSTVVNRDIIYTLLSSIIFMNSVLNPFVYSIANTKFREDCVLVFRKLRSKMCRTCKCTCKQCA